MSEINELPKGWEVTTLGDIVSISSGKGLVQAKQDSSGEFLVYGGNGVNGRHNDYLHEDSKLIIGRVGVHCGNIHISKPKSWITDNAFVVTFDFNELDVRYLYYLIGTLNLNKYSSSTAQPVISQGKLYPIKLSICPLPEQHRIVSKIEELFSSLDKGVESLKTARQQLKVYRQAVLKWAFEGRLTNENVVDGELPEGWKFFRIDQIASVGTGATPLKSNKIFYENGTVAWVTSGALNDENVRKASDYVTEAAVNQTNLTVYPKHTLLLAMYGEGKTRGKCSELLIEACTNQAIAAVFFEKHDIRVKPYLKYFLLKNYYEVRKLAAGGVQPNLNLGIVKSTSLPIPATLTEQQAIVAEIESRLSVCDKIEESITKSLLQAEALRQSILKKAFEGKLVPQDPADEPASVLLERIKAERERVPLPGKSSKVKVKMVKQDA